MMTEILKSKSDKESNAEKAIKALTELALSEPVYRKVLETVTENLKSEDK